MYVCMYVIWEVYRPQAIPRLVSGVENSDMLACAVLTGREANGMNSLKALR